MNPRYFKIEVRHAQEKAFQTHYLNAAKLQNGSLKIGSGLECDIVLDSPFVSNTHAEIKMVNEHFLLVDSDSSNGTLIDGVELKGSLEIEQPTVATIRPFMLTISPIEEELLFNVEWYQEGQLSGQLSNCTLPIHIGRTAENSVTLPHPEVSENHLQVRLTGNQLMVEDLGSSNGLKLNDKPIQASRLELKDILDVGPFKLKLSLAKGSSTGTKTPPQTVVIDQPDASVNLTRRHQGGDSLPFCEYKDKLQPFPALSTCDLSAWPDLIAQPTVSEEDLLNTSLEVEEKVYLSIGGGMGSFAWVDRLRVSSVPASSIITLGFAPMEPYGRYKALCQNSQIYSYSRLRSNSDSHPANLWGWPGLAIEESWRHMQKGRLLDAARPVWTVFAEPYVQPYTPQSQDVFDSIDLEAARIGWGQIWREGRVEIIRKTQEGRYAVFVTLRQSGANTQQIVVLCSYLHLAIGYSGVKFLPDLLEYRKRTGDTVRVVNAYEDHRHVYERLERHGGVVLLRGRGIVASRVLDRLHEIRRKHERTSAPQRIKILHLMRTPKPKGHTYKSTQRIVKNSVAFQHFNYSKALWGGPAKELLENATAPERDALLDVWGGTTTAYRHEWQETIDRGLREAWYEISFGHVKRVFNDLHEEKVVTVIENSNIDIEQKLFADFVIDATGLDSGIKSNPLLNDLISTYNLRLNPRGRLDVSPDFELIELRNANARIYASGVSTLGGPYAPVDSFLGLTYSALRIAEHLRKQGAPSIKNLSGLRSLYGWIQFALGVKLK